LAKGTNTTTPNTQKPPRPLHGKALKLAEEQAQLTTENLSIDGMSCVGCQNRIRTCLLAVDGVKSTDVDWRTGKATVTFKHAVCSKQTLEDAVYKLGYDIRGSQKREKPLYVLATALSAIVVFLLIRRFGAGTLTADFSVLNQGTLLATLLLIGLLTSVHCIAMCGGINLSQTCTSGVQSSLLYNIGRVLSYTVIGGFAGALGGVLHINAQMRGTIQLVVGVLTVCVGLVMCFPSVRRLLPRRKSDCNTNRGRSSFVVGLLNGFMPCGPLQAMQLYALSTGSWSAGALSLFLFGMGTLPLMFGLGWLSNLLSRKFLRIVRVCGAVLVLAMGLSLFAQGMSLRGVSVGSLAASSGMTNVDRGSVVVGAGKPVFGIFDSKVQEIFSTMSRTDKYPNITVKAGVPVRWSLDVPAKYLTGCNKQIYIPAWDVYQELRVGHNQIEFTPTKPGVYTVTCWMGMVSSTITVE
jgi:sulfite exporter TauE/SafE/copper chaperone CopZ